MACGKSGRHSYVLHTCCDESNVEHRDISVHLARANSVVCRVIFSRHVQRSHQRVSSI